jgi:hypothetical protein
MTGNALDDGALPVMHCRAERARDGHRVVWTFLCPHCRRRHTHGAGPGHRVAHCNDPSSPYEASGYVLALAPQGARKVTGS